jgi:hypothetical protein
MGLLTQGYLSRIDRERELAQPDPGWGELRRGLHNLLLGYLLCFLCVVLAAALVAFVIVEMTSKNRWVDNGDLTTILFAGGGIIFLLGLSSFGVLIRGKVRCLMHAPERYGARWWMFSSILCILIGPTLNFIAPFIHSAKPAVQVTVTSKDGDGTRFLTRELDSYKHFKDAYEISMYLKLAGNFAALLSTVFFVLFLRAVAQSFNNELQTKLCEFYLMFTGLLVGGFLMLCFGPALDALSLIYLLLGLAAGQVINLFWYIFLIISTSSTIGAGIGRGRLI